MEVDMAICYQIRTLKADIFCKHGKYPSEHMHLFLVDNLDEELDCCESITDFRICSNIIKNGLVLKIYGFIQIQNYNKNEYCKDDFFLINVDGADTIKQIKSTIEKEMGIPSNIQELSTPN